MKYLFLSILLVVFSIIGYFLVSFFSSSEFHSKENSLPECPADFFTKGAVIFDSLLICGTERVPDGKLEHAAKVTAEWLDNDKNGIIDDLRVADAIKESKAVLVMSKEGFDFFAISKFEQGTFGLQDLSAAETKPINARDASQEETNHLIFNYGWSKVFPEVFSDEKGSELYDIWESVDGRYYNYDDPTCDPSCKVGEYLYKATAAYFGAEGDLADDELTLKSRKELREKNPRIVSLFENEAYNYPRFHWPDGKYEFQGNIVYLK